MKKIPHAILACILLALSLAGCSKYPLSPKGVYHTDKSIAGLWIPTIWHRADQGALMIVAEDRDTYSLIGCDPKSHAPTTDKAFPTKIDGHLFLNFPVKVSRQETEYLICELVVSDHGNRLKLVPLPDFPKEIHSSAELYRYVQAHLPELSSAKPTAELRRF